MAGAVRADMVTEGLDCEAAKRLVPKHQVLQQERGPGDPVQVRARYGAASLLVEAGDVWLPDDPATAFAGVRIDTCYIEECGWLYEQNAAQPAPTTSTHHAFL